VVTAQKQFSYEPEEIFEDLFAIPLPLYDGSPVNAYVVRDGQGVWLIDGGLATAECQDILERGLRALGHEPGDIRGLLITHGHTDHVGAARTVLANHGQVLAHRVETNEGRDLAFDEEWLVRNGLPLDRLTESRWHEPDWPAPTHVLEDGEEVEWGALKLRVVWCPGHTRGLVCLFEPNRSLLFTTDHVMRRAPAPVTVRAPLAEDPLGDYLSSVRKLNQVPAQTVLPGHGRPARLAQIEQGIARQLAQVTERLAGGPATAYDLLALDELRDRRPVAERYAISQVLARLRHLDALGEVEAVDDGQTIQYRLTKT
jgi:glyoxylase-like metal-dependent hydrolase (beta-lactamase superfamily II)